MCFEVLEPIFELNLQISLQLLTSLCTPGELVEGRCALRHGGREGDKVVQNKLALAGLAAVAKVLAGLELYIPVEVRSL